MFDYLLTLTACIISGFGYWVYYNDLKKAAVKPSRFSWLIGSLFVSLETLTYNSLSGDWVKSACFFVSAIACILITIKIWYGSKWSRPCSTDIFATVFCAGSLAVWYVYQSDWQAHLILLLSIPILSYPTFKNAFADFSNEDSKAWYIWIVSDVVELVLVCGRLQSVQELPYALTEFLCHAVVAGLVIYGKINAKQNRFSVKPVAAVKNLYTVHSNA